MGVARLRPDEVELVGQWIPEGKGVEADETAKRIEGLVREWLEPVADSSDGWDRLFKDPSDGRFWERTYPRNHMHGGGPPELKVVSAEAARGKYRIEI